MVFREIITLAVLCIEAVGVLVIIVGSAVSSFRFLAYFSKQP